MRGQNDSGVQAQGFLPYLCGAMQSLDVENYMCHEWLDAAWVRNILCRSPVYHQSGVQADDQALKDVQHINYHFMLCDFRGRGICTLTLVHLHAPGIRNHAGRSRGMYYISHGVMDKLDPRDQVKLSDFFHSVPMLYELDLILDIE